MVGVRVIASIVNGHKMMCTLLLHCNNCIHIISDVQIIVQSSTICHFLNLGFITLVHN